MLNADHERPSQDHRSKRLETRKSVAHTQYTLIRCNPLNISYHLVHACQLNDYIVVANGMHQRNALCVWRFGGDAKQQQAIEHAARSLIVLNYAVNACDFPSPTDLVHMISIEHCAPVQDKRTKYEHTQGGYILCVAFFIYFIFPLLFLIC